MPSNVYEALSNALSEAQAGVEADILKARGEMEGLLNDIVSQAVQHGDNKAVMEQWKIHRMGDFSRSSKTMIAWDKFYEGGQLGWILRELKSSKRTMTEMRRSGLVGPKTLKLKKEFEPNAIFFQGKPFFWKNDISIELVKLKELVWKHSKLSKDQKTILTTWFDAMKDALDIHLQTADDMDLAGLQVKIELWRLKRLVAMSNLNFFKSASDLTLKPWAEVAEVVKRIRASKVAWPTDAPAGTTSKSLNKRQMGLRAAGIYGVPHRAAF
ncbi:hypothetical protein JCM3765_000261 [Sporobolomyces pararoseus]